MRTSLGVPPIKQQMYASGRSKSVTCINRRMPATTPIHTTTHLRRSVAIAIVERAHAWPSAVAFFHGTCHNLSSEMGCVRRSTKPEKVCGACGGAGVNAK